ncbi:MAG: hypothetical protein AUG91_08875 [Actinobacteria bacterium 13_1_20CM_4_69_9]|nr:MAG: hypothetical protein AUG91_08875 [Actinobacteria bacterium 13_1_20CM_4_69_9]
MVAQASYAATGLGLPAIAPAIRRDFDLTLTQTGVVLAASFLGSVPTLLAWGLIADRIGERLVMAIGLACSCGALVWAANASSFGMALPLLEQHVSLHAAFLGLAGASLVGAIVALVFIRVEPSEDQSALARPLRDRRVWLICLGSTFFVTTQLSLLGFFVLFLHDHRGVSTAVAAAALAVTQVLGGISRIALGRWSDRIHMRIVPLRRVGLGIAISVAVTTVLLDAPTWIIVPALVVAATFGLSWNGLSFTATAETAGRARSGAAIGLQQTFLAAGGIVAPIAFAAVVHHASWRLAFGLAALSPLVGYALLSPLAERRP